MAKLTTLRAHLQPIVAQKPGVFQLGYQILEQLRDENPVLVGQSEADRGTAVGRGGGAPWGPASVIAVCLADWGEIEVGQLSGDGLRIGDIDASGEVMGIFRLRPENQA